MEYIVVDGVGNYIGDPSIYSPRFIIIESFCHFGTFHSIGLFLFLVKLHIFPHLLYSLLLFSLFISLLLFISHFILPLLNSPNTIFLNLRAGKKRLHYYVTERVHHSCHMSVKITYSTNHNPFLVILTALLFVCIYSSRWTRKLHK